MNRLVLLAGDAALARLRDGGLAPDAFSHFGAAAGGPKWLILNRLDRALFGDWLRARRRPLPAVGASIGSWRLACAAQRDPVAAIERFEAAYLDQRYGPRPTLAEVSLEAERILRALLGPTGIAEILAHPWLQLHVVSARCRGWLGSPQPLLEKLGFAAAFATNALSRPALGALVDRTLLHSGGAPLRLRDDGFRTQAVPLSATNLVPALMGSASIPGVMLPVRDLPGAPAGSYIDGGMVDYHMDLPLAEPELMLLPHFGVSVTPGWLDKFLPWRRARNLAHTLLVAPSAAFLATLPNGRIPDRLDFQRYAGDDAARVRDWRRAVEAGQQLADEFMELVLSGRIAQRVAPLPAPG